ncbi:MAG TPA: glycosyltransferase family 87 protein [Tepidisphaeraceae bacterium]|jgi:hypothetical protein|nr:glycosyltransferase family 87 protein [Tepidisphaeraceae bacterium]
MLQKIRKLDVVRFNRLCSICGLAFLVLTIGAKCAWYEHRHLPQMQDYPQYYMGGLVALHGAWDSMYPIPNPGSHTNPGFVGNSTLRPGYLALALSHGVTEESVRYMQPPPLALFLIPLALLPLKLSYYFWVLLLILCAWGIGRQAGTILEMSLGRPSHGFGFLVLLICLSPQAHRWIRVGNMSVIIGWLIGYAVIELVRRDGPRSAIAMTLGTLAKYALLVLGPLQIAMRRWRTIAWEIALMIAILIIAFLVMGAAPFQTFLHEIAPTLGRTSTIAENSAIYAFILRLKGLEDDSTLSQACKTGFHLLELGSLLLILALVLLRPQKFWNRPNRIFAAATALVAWLLLFSPIFWEHYHAYLAPFWGWLAFEATRSRARMIVAILIVALAYLPTSILLSHLHFAQLPEPLFSHLMWSTVIMFLFAIDRLARDRANDPPECPA